MVSFIRILAAARAEMRRIHIFMEQSGDFSAVQSEMSPFSGHSPFSGQEQLSLSFSVNGDLKRWIDPEKRGFGAELVVNHECGKWTLEAEYGWAGQDIGWAPVASQAAEFESSEPLLECLVPWAERLRIEVIGFLEQRGVA